MRAPVIKLVEKTTFEYFILVVILASSIHLMLDNPLYDPNGKFIRALVIIDTIISTIFTIEAVLKIFAYGLFFNGEKSYFRHMWNWLDFIIVVFSVRISYSYIIVGVII